MIFSTPSKFWSDRRIFSLGLAVIALAVSGPVPTSGFYSPPAIKAAPTTVPVVTPIPESVSLPFLETNEGSITGITRLAQVHTERPERPRFKVFINTRFKKAIHPGRFHKNSTSESKVSCGATRA